MLNFIFWLMSAEIKHSPERGNISTYFFCTWLPERAIFFFEYLHFISMFSTYSLIFSSLLWAWIYISELGKSRQHWSSSQSLYYRCISIQKYSKIAWLLTSLNKLKHKTFWFLDSFCNFHFYVGSYIGSSFHL